MPIDILVKGDPESCRQAGAWLGTALAEAVHDGGSDIYRARGDSEWGWGGSAGPAFRSRMATAGQDADRLQVDSSAIGRAFQVYGDDLFTAQSGMKRARQIALEGGLEVTDTSIIEPGPAPPVPTPLLQTGPISTSAQAAYDSAVQAQQTYAQQVSAYNAAQGEASAARGVLTRGQEALATAARGIWGKRYITAFDSGATLFSAYGRRANYWLSAAQDYRSQALTANRNLTDMTRAARNGQFGGDRAAFYRRLDAETQRYNGLLQRADEMTKRAFPSRLSRAAWSVRTAVTNVSASVAPGATALARSTLSKVPIVGLGVTAWGIGHDVNHGKPPGQAVVSGLAGMGAGLAVAGTVAAVGGPVGWGVGGAIAAGIVVGYGAEWAYSEFMPEGAKDAIDDGLRAAGGAVEDGWDAVSGGARKAWDAVF